MKKKNHSRLPIINPRYLALKYCLRAFKDINGRLLDVGCGAGLMTKEIKRLRPDLEVYGIDSDQQAIRLARKGSQGLKFSLNNAYNLPFKDNYFDATFNHHFLEHLSNPAKALEEINRVTKKNGKIYASVPLETNWSSIHALFYKLTSYKAMRLKYTGHLQQYSFRQINELFRKAGFQITEYYWSGFLLSKLTNFMYYSIANLLKLPTSFLKENDLLEKQNSFYGRFGTAIKRLLYSLTNLESMFIPWFPQEIVHIIAKKIPLRDRPASGGAGAGGKRIND